MRLTLRTDGGSRGNPGPAAAGVILEDTETEQRLHEAGYHLGSQTNNVAEYEALRIGLELALEMAPEQVRVLSDSELLVRQLTGEYRVKSANLQPLFEQIQRMLLRAGHWQVHHVPREQNRAADEMVRAALDAGEDVLTREAATAGAREPSALASAAEASDPAPGEEHEAEAPAWRIQFREDTGKKCPAGHRAYAEFAFGSTTPSGLCIHAAAAAMRDGDHEGPDEGETTCARCRVRLRIEVDS